MDRELLWRCQGNVKKLGIREVPVKCCEGLEKGALNVGEDMEV